MRFISNIWFTIKTVFYGIVPSLFYVYNNFKKSIRPFFVGIFTVFLCVCFLCILQNTVSQVPSIFLRISENQIGEGDILLVASSSSDNVFLNYTDIYSKLLDCERCDNAYPRWLFYCFVNSTTNETTEGILNIYNSTYEYEHDIGRGWDFDPLEKNTFVLSGPAARSIGLNVGDVASITIDVFRVAEYLGYDLDEDFLNSFGLVPSYDVGIPLLIVDPLGTNNGTEIITELYDFELVMNQTGDPVLTSMFVKGVEMYISDAYDYYTDPDCTEDAMDYFIIENDSIMVTYGLIVDLNDTDLQNALIASKQFTLKGIAESPEGKYTNSIGNVISMDQSDGQDFIEEIGKQMIDYYYQKILERFEEFGAPDSILEQITNRKDQLMQNLTIDLNEMAQNIYIQATERIRAYYDGDKLMRKLLIEATDEVADLLGINDEINISTPLKTVVMVFNYLMYLLQQIFNFIVVVFAFMGGLLIYSLLIADVEEKTYEFGMLRALGLLKALLVEILMLESTFFSIVGILFGLVLGWIGSIAINLLITSLSHLPPSFFPTYISVLVPFLIGLLVPFFANIMPIKRALSHTLRDALDLYHSATNDVSVSIKRLKDIGMNPTVIMFSLVLVCASFITYYVIPLTFLDLNFSVLFFCFLVILLIFLAGLCLLSQTLQPILQTAISYVIITPFQNATQSVVLKNLDSHSPRNTKTALMLTVAISFILFAGGSFSLANSTIVNFVKQQQGSDISVASPSGPLNKELLDSYLYSSDLISNFSYVTHPLSSIINVDTDLSNIAMYPTFDLNLIAVDDRFTKTVYTDMITPVNVDKSIDYSRLSRNPDVISSLFTSPRAQSSDEPPETVLNQYFTEESNYPPSSYFYENYTDILVAEGLHNYGSIKAGGNVRIQVSGEESISLLGRVRSTLRSMPGQSFSSYYTMAAYSPIVTSISQFQEILSVLQTTFGLEEKPEVVYKSLYIKIKDITKREAETLVQDLRTIINDKSVIVTDTQQLLSTITSSMSLLQIFFAIVSLLAMCLCFFVMLLSYTSNVHENSWEFAVLRAVGFSAFKVIMIYIYESLCLTFASLILGTFIGLGVAALVNMQFVVFLQLPYVFSFPWINASVVYVLSIIISIIASLIPAYGLTRKPISNVLKGQI
ncbi:ABC3 transporter permease C-terminal domain-containing protein [Entamoeba marina]